MKALPEGVRHVPAALNLDAQRSLVAAIRAVVAQAPLYTPEMPRTGKPMRVRMTNCGALGWLTDKDRGYRYQETHPVTGQPWPPMPVQLLDLWRTYAHWPDDPQACLINFYDADARMGLHQDRDEDSLEAPVLSISLGDTCLFRIGGLERGGPTQSLRLASGDIIVLEGPSRLRFHGVDRIYPDTSPLLARGRRINLTQRRVT